MLRAVERHPLVEKTLPWTLLVMNTATGGCPTVSAIDRAADEHPIRHKPKYTGTCPRSLP